MILMMMMMVVVVVVVMMIIIIIMQTLDGKQSVNARPIRTNVRSIPFGTGPVLLQCKRGLNDIFFII